MRNRLEIKRLNPLIVANKYDPGFAEAMGGGGREEEGAWNGEGGQEKGTQTQGTQTEEVTQKEVGTQKE
ncbi:hypothetical protein VE01_06255 [Pseudogymnoascus verrucosus]|uniref:Uncharacterized protein n=1 Tax=Pseudogymnoascus verrucosus TaxID=342668 RepID=A0A1B8GG10_9PEZI|nr:uncharacterized protein VE01_06255 [Pseudogymnoascus verrucosus]OBT94767.2 hypothetical protein VE01_06255 [Pseudogymnoascus verrucosus]